MHRMRLLAGAALAARLLEDARGNIRSWVGFGGMMDNPRALPPWTCTLGTVVRCWLRMSFGGTRPERTYRLRFRITKS